MSHEYTASPYMLTLVPTAVAPYFLSCSTGSELAAVAAQDVAAVAAAAASLGSGPSMNRLMSLAAANSLAGSASDRCVCVRGGCLFSDRFCSVVIPQ
jgi:predicted alpha/beta hydrolase